MQRGKEVLVCSVSHALATVYLAIGSEALEARRLVEPRDRWAESAGVGRVGGRAGPRLPVATRPARRRRGEGSQEAHA